MFRSSQIVAALLILLLSFVARAVPNLPAQSDFDKIYQSVVAKIRSDSSAEDKLLFINTKNAEYLSLGEQIMAQSSQKPEIRNTTVFSYFFELYDKMIPLVKIKMHKDSKVVSKRSCLEAARLVQAPATGSSLGGLALRDAATVDLLAILCRSAKN